jgi:hypothetical protein
MWLENIESAYITYMQMEINIIIDIIITENYISKTAKCFRLLIPAFSNWSLQAVTRRRLGREWSKRRKQPFFGDSPESIMFLYGAGLCSLTSRIRCFHFQLKGT